MDHTETMGRVRFIEHRGIPILLSDLSGLRETAELQRIVRLGGEKLQARPPGSTLVLVDVTGVEYNLESFAVLQQSVAVNRPFVRARAIVGLPSAAAIPFQVVEDLSESPMASFDSRDAAMEWLVSQPSHPG
jgi:hypothetical protein